MKGTETNSTIARIIQILVAISGLYVAIKNDFGGDASLTQIFLTFIVLLFLIFLVGLFENFFSKSSIKIRNILAGAFATLLFVFIVFSLAVLFVPKLSCDFHETFFVEVLGVGSAQSCAQMNQPPHIPETDEPNKRVRALDNTPYKTRAYWAGGAAFEEFVCHRSIPSGSKLIIIGFHEAQNLGKTRAGTYCEVPAPYCDSHNEYCVNYDFTKACFINTEWYDWYKKHCEENGLPFNDSAVCQ
ncbi:hypothetical protein [Neolewinella persica]|uniref:hypothetical protein n=1 Tax=Neolewinella persica TaxID=70998 RepID=UPI000361EA45|nr:hypothetical protein [Neolewinella persica]